MQQLGTDAAMPPFSELFRVLTDYSPFPWQEALFQQFLKSDGIPTQCDIPTGLGKTNVMVIWLIARAHGASLPRRLVYVVDRRAVVDQATEVAVRLRNVVSDSPELRAALDIPSGKLSISTLRGQHVDNKEWLADPASPAIIVGTVDMIGSRLLFEGYGISRKMRPYHAGLLGADTLVVLDESHLVPPFEKLLETIADGATQFGPREETLREVIPPFRLLSLSATARAGLRESFGLTPADLKHSTVRQRLDAAKRLEIVPLADSKKLPGALAAEAWKLAGNGATAVRIIVFCDLRKDAEKTADELRKLAKRDGERPAPEIELFVGGRRVRERQQAAAKLSELGFIADTKGNPLAPAFLIATSAGEVGVDLDADHMVSDLVAWERMVQRLGRVNRRGEGDARVIVVASKDNAWAKPLDCLPHRDGCRDASPGAIRDLKLKAANDSDLHAILDAATTSPPLRPALSRALVDAWSMTSREHHTGRPDIEPWLRGWVPVDPQTRVVWRVHMPNRRLEGEASSAQRKALGTDIATFFEAASPHASEVLEAETSDVVNWLTDRVAAYLKSSKSHESKADSDETSKSSATLRRDDLAIVALQPSGDLRTTHLLNELAFSGDDKRSDKRRQDDLYRTLAGATLVIDARLAGLGEKGLLDTKAEQPPVTADDQEVWLPPVDGQPVIRFRVSEFDAALDTDADSDDERDSNWRERFRFALISAEDGRASRCLAVEKWRFDAAMEDDRSAGAGPPQLLDAHQHLAEIRVRSIAQRLQLPQELTELLAVTARLHDEGKRTQRWQQAFKAPRDGGIYAKTRGPINYALLDGYRHEFGTLPIAAQDPGFLALHDDLQDLALHLIAAHHGFARPIISVRGCDDAPSILADRARDVALRFVRLQKRWGAWGLAWWESLLRAADQQASRENDGSNRKPKRENV